MVTIVQATRAARHRSGKIPVTVGTSSEVFCGGLGNVVDKCPTRFGLVVDSLFRGRIIADFAEPFVASRFVVEASLLGATVQLKIP